MSNCIVCLETFKFPAALPCGHVFCYDCIRSLVNSAQPFTTEHLCPTCRRPYSTATIDPSFVPERLRPYVTPAIRQLYVETPGPSPPRTPSGPTSAAPSPTAAHFPPLQPAHQNPVNMNLAAFARVARDQALRMRAERDELEKKYNGLKGKYGVLKRRYEQARETDDPQSEERPPKDRHFASTETLDGLKQEGVASP